MLRNQAVRPPGVGRRHAPRRSDFPQKLRAVVDEETVELCLALNGEDRMHTPPRRIVAVGVREGTTPHAAGHVAPVVLPRIRFCWVLASNIDHHRNPTSVPLC